MTDGIYLDFNATTPIDPRVIDAMQPALREGWGNPSSSHAVGRAARAMVMRSREQVAGLLGCGLDELVFTSGGSESNNHALKGVAFASERRHIITSQIEHPAVLAPCAWLERQGFRVTRLPVDKEGLVAPADLRAALDDDTALVSVMHANNETGAMQPVAELAAAAHEVGALFHTDAAQSVGKVPVTVDALGVDLLTVAGHKLYAPKGVGALYVRAGTPLEPLVHGAGHEGGRRAGTENVPYMVALGAAAELAAAELPRFADEVAALRDELERLLDDATGGGLTLNGPRAPRLPNTLNVNLPGVEGGAVLAAAEGVMASTGSACHEDEVTLSPVLAAMGVAPERGRGAVRLSLGRGTTHDDVNEAARRLSEAFARVQRG
jgi:cysteine desulfurase